MCHIIKPMNSATFVKIWCDISWQECMDGIQLQDLIKLLNTQTIGRVF